MADDVEKAVETDAAEDAASAGFKLTWKHKSAICGAALTLCGPFIQAHEGLVFKSYRDVGRIWTVCEGVAGAIPNHTYTKAECDKMDAQALQVKIDGVAKEITFPITPTFLAANVDFAYNVGMGNYQHSSVLRLTNSGQLAAGCDAMLKFYKAAGYDCRVRSNNCFGVWQRRLDERKLCLQGVK